MSEAPTCGKHNMVVLPLEEFYYCPACREAYLLQAELTALQQALEALESFEPYDSFLWQQRNNTDIDKAITALRQAIEAAHGIKEKNK